MTSARVWGNRKPFRVEKNHFKVEEKKMLKKKNVAFHLEAKKNKKSNCSYWPLFFVVVVVVVVHFQLHYRRCSRYRRRDWDARRPTIGTLRSVGLFCSFLFCFCFLFFFVGFPIVVTQFRHETTTLLLVGGAREAPASPLERAVSGRPIRKRTNQETDQSGNGPIRSFHWHVRSANRIRLTVKCRLRTRQFRVSRGFDRFFFRIFIVFFYWVLLFFFLVLLVSTGFYWVVLGFTGFYWVLLDFI